MFTSEPFSCRRSLVGLLSAIVLAGCADAGVSTGTVVVPCGDDVPATCDCGDTTLGSTVCFEGGNTSCDCSSPTGADAGNDIGIIERDTSGGEDAVTDTVDCEELLTFWPDGDGDTFGDIVGDPVRACEAPAGYTDRTGDCDDSSNSVYPGAGELCDGVDNNCDARVDETADRVAQWVDGDGDGFGERGSEPVFDCEPLPGRSVNDRDCDDTDGSVYPGATEACDGADNDCNGRVDDNLTFTTWWADADDDGYGDDETDPQSACTAPDGWIDNNQDCDDADDTINP